MGAPRAAGSTPRGEPVPGAPVPGEPDPGGWPSGSDRPGEPPSTAESSAARGRRWLAGLVRRAARSGQRSPREGSRPLAREAALATMILTTAVMLALLVHDARPLDALGWALLVPSAVLLAWRVRYPLAVLLAIVALAATYHGMDYNHVAPIPITAVALYSVAVVGPRRRTAWVTVLVVTIVVIVMASGDQHQRMDLLRTSGWLLLLMVLGEAVRVHRDYVAAIVERAERAERSREEEAARRVAEERLHIARDLHDLLAHSITLIGVQTSVAAHVLVADPDRLDRAALARALDGIADTCRDAREEIRTTLRVLRSQDPRSPHGHGPLPGLSGLPDLVRTAEAGGAVVRMALAEDVGAVPPVVGAAAYRVVQQSLTNTVQHAGPGVRVTVEVRRAADGGALLVRVADQGPVDGAPRGPVAATARGHSRGRTGREGEPAEAPPGAGDFAAPHRSTRGARSATGEVGPRSGGFGIAGMRERARSVGGSLTAEPCGAGFTVTATLPLDGSTLPVPGDPPEETPR